MCKIYLLPIERKETYENWILNELILINFKISNSNLNVRTYDTLDPITSCGLTIL